MGRNDARKRKQITVSSSFTSLCGFPYNQSCETVSQICAWTTDATHDLKSGVWGGGGSLFLKHNSGEKNNTTPQEKRAQPKLWGGGGGGGGGFLFWRS